MASESKPTFFIKKERKLVESICVISEDFFKVFLRYSKEFLQCFRRSNSCHLVAFLTFSFTNLLLKMFENQSWPNYERFCLLGEENYVLTTSLVSV